MGLSLWTVVQAVLLFTNAFAILNEERFLKKREYATSEALGMPLLLALAHARRARPKRVLGVIGRELTRELPSPPSSIADGITLASATNESFYGGPTPNNSLKAQVVSKIADAFPCQASDAS